MSDINRVVLTGRLTKDPELRALPDQTPVLAIRLAFSSRKRDAQGQWGDAPNYIDVSVIGSRAEALSRLLEKGRLIGVDGRLRWREWEDKDGARRQAIDIIADTIELLGGRSEGQGSTVSAGADQPDETPAVDESRGSPFEDDIPF